MTSKSKGKKWKSEKVKKFWLVVSAIFSLEFENFCLKKACHYKG